MERREPWFGLSGMIGMAEKRSPKAAHQIELYESSRTEKAFLRVSLKFASKAYKKEEG